MTYTNVLACAEEPSGRKNSLYDFTLTSIGGETVNLARFKGKVLLVVNTASKCGFTPQYHDLENLYKEYNSKGLEILGFPSNDFANQEPGTNAEIKKFCSLNFGVTFPLFSRGPVSGSEKQGVYKYLTEESGKEFQGEISWNFEKFLVDRNGKVKARFGSYINPESQRIKTVLQQLLNEKAR